MKPTILLIEDDITIREELAKLLKQEGYFVDAVIDFEKVLTSFDFITYQVILLDITLPFEDGFTLCKKIKEIKNIPILFVTSSTREEDELKSILSGGDDFITKPYHTGILLEKLKRLLLRGQEEVLYYQKEGLTFDLAESTISYQQKKEELTRNERRVLHYLFMNQGKIISKEQFLGYLWNDKYYLDEGVLLVTINRLRKKLKDIGKENFIETIRGRGYRI